MSSYGSVSSQPYISPPHSRTNSLSSLEKNITDETPADDVQEGYDTVDFSERAPLLSNRKLFRSLSGREIDHNAQTDEQHNRMLGTFSGVFAPVSLSQFSTVLFLRVGFIIGNLGFFAGSGTLVLAYGILIFTVFSICAISTNGAVEGGGAYFMISRTLGPEFGGAIGSLFFLANIFSSGLYATGCVEGLIQNFGTKSGTLANFLPEENWWYSFGYRSALNFFNFLICLVGPGLFAKTTLGIFFLVICAAGFSGIDFMIPHYDNPINVTFPPQNTAFENKTVLYKGFEWDIFKENMGINITSIDYTTNTSIDFATIFGVLFSGITGIMSGANMSGELKNPSYSIPRGTLMACLFTFLTYLFLFFLTSATTARVILQNNYGYMLAIALSPQIICIGNLTATISAALSNLIGASRVLAALVKDSIFGPVTDWIEKLTYKNNPLGSVIVSFFLVEFVLLIRQLNTIAPITSVFFLLSYLATNIACLGLQWASAPNFRPTFKYFSWWTALLGILGNGIMMFVISPEYAGVCVGLCLMFVIVLHLRSPSKLHQWGSISQALIFHQVRKYLLLLDQRKDHVKFWRPQMLLLVANPRSACPLIDFVNDLKKSGLYILGHVKVADYDGSISDPALEDVPKWLALIDHLKVKAFVEVTVAQSVRSGLHQLARISGLGAMKPNTIILGFHDDTPPEDFFTREGSSFSIIPHSNQASRSSVLPANSWQLEPRESFEEEVSAQEYVCMIRDVLNMGKNVCICRHFNLLDKEELFKNSSRQKPFIDVWPMNFFNPDSSTFYDTTSLFLMQLATILNMVSTWKNRSQVRIFMCLSSRDEDSEQQKDKISKMLSELRIAGTIVTVEWDHVNHFLRNQENPEIDEDSKSYDMDLLSDDYVRAANHLVLKNSIDTAVTFMYLPRPPDNQNQYSPYLHALTLLTKHLRPTILVRGVSAVTTTNL